MSITVNGTNGLTFNDGSSQNTAATGFGFKNRIINGAMGIWQRGTSAAGSYPTYLADRWMNYRSVAGSTFSRQTTSDTTNLPNIQYCQRIQRDSGNTSTVPIYISQSIETNNSISAVGGSVTLSFWARAGANFSAASGNMNFEIVYGTGTDQNVIAGFTGQAYAASGTKTLTTTWQRFSATGTVPATATQLAVNLYFTPVGTAGASDYMEITGVQLEVGSTATSFDYRPYGTELALCQRYYQTGQVLIRGNSATSGFVYYWNFWPVQMRIGPTVTISNTTYSNGAAGGANASSQYGTEFAFSVSGASAYMQTNFASTAEL